MVWEVAGAVKVPILGMGGVSTGKDAAEMMLAGADAVALGAICFTEPYAPLRAVEELEELAQAQGLAKITELTGAVKPW